MDLNRLYKLFDSRITDAESYSREDYRAVAKAFPDNFYAVLAAKLSSLWEIARKNNSRRDTPTNFEPFEVLGNTVIVSYKDDKLKVNIGGKTAYEGKAGSNAVANAIQGVVDAERRGVFSISRPRGRRMYSDAKDLNPDNISDKGLKFPKNIYKKMLTTPEGELNKSAKANSKSRLSLSETDYNYLVKNEGLDPSSYYKSGDRYIRKDIHYYQIPRKRGLKYLKPLPNINDLIMEEEPDYKKFYEEASRSGGTWIANYNGVDYRIMGEHVEKYHLA